MYFIDKDDYNQRFFAHSQQVQPGPKQHPQNNPPGQNLFREGLPHLPLVPALAEWHKIQNSNLCARQTYTVNDSPKNPSAFPEQIAIGQLENRFSLFEKNNESNVPYPNPVQRNYPQQAGYPNSGFNVVLDPRPRADPLATVSSACWMYQSIF